VCESAASLHHVPLAEHRVVGHEIAADFLVEHAVSAPKDRLPAGDPALLVAEDADRLLLVAGARALADALALGVGVRDPKRLGGDPQTAE